MGKWRATARPDRAAEPAPAATALRIVVAGGGTGGHLYPAIAIADALQRLRPGTEVHFLGARDGLEARVLPQAGRPVWLLDVSRVRGLGPAARVAATWRLMAAVRRAAGHLRAMDPHLVVGVGGYASAAGVLAAALLRVPRVVHEQNAIAGWTNRLLARVAHRIYTSFDQTEGLRGRRVVVTGNPVREAVRRTRSRAARGAARPPWHLLVLGGSQGARFLDTQGPALAARLVALGQPVEVWHQSRPEDRAAVEAAYAHAQVRATVVPFVEAIERAYAWADLALCRAGASTVAELAVVGLPAILVPFPHAASHHQHANARWLAGAGAADVVDQATFDVAAVAGQVAPWLDPGALRRRAEAARAVARADAAEAIARDCLGLLGARPVGTPEAGP